MQYYDPMFYICSKEMPFGIRIETFLKNRIDGKILENAVNIAIKRYPYFSVKLTVKDGDIVTEFNPLPVKVFKGELPFPLGDKNLNYHLVALSFIDNKINIYTTHVITDGAGFMPFLKSVLYYYVCEATGKDIPHESIRLSSDPLYADEIINPYPEEKMKEATPFLHISDKEFFRLSDGDRNEIDLYKMLDGLVVLNGKDLQ